MGDELNGVFRVTTEFNICAGVEGFSKKFSLTSSEKTGRFALFLTL